MLPVTSPHDPPGIPDRSLKADSRSKRPRARDNIAISQALVKTNLTTIPVVCLIVLMTLSATAETPPGAAAAAAAKSWLEFADADRYSQVWEGTAAEVKTLVSRRKWEDLISSQRRPLGRVLSRKVIRNLPNASGAIITFQTSFEKKKSAAEMLVIVREADGKWRVQAYEIL